MELDVVSVGQFKLALHLFGQPNGLRLIALSLSTAVEMGEFSAYGNITLQHLLA